MKARNCTYSQLISAYKKEKIDYVDPNPCPQKKKLKLLGETFKDRSARMAKLNENISKYFPEQRSLAGTKGGLACIALHRKTESGFFNKQDNFPIQREGNFRGSYIYQFAKVPREQLHPRWAKFILEAWPYQYKRSVFSLEEYRMVIEYGIVTYQDFLDCKVANNIPDPPVPNLSRSQAKATLFLAPGEMLL